MVFFDIYFDIGVATSYPLLLSDHFFKGNYNGTYYNGRELNCYKIDYKVELTNHYFIIIYSFCCFARLLNSRQFGNSILDLLYSDRYHKSYTSDIKNCRRI